MPMSTSPRLVHPLFLVVALAGGICILLGLLVMAGWHLRDEALLRLHPAFVPMQYNTAMLFVFSGAALLALAWGRRKLAAGIGAVVATIGLLVLAQYIFRVDFGIDQLLIRDHLSVPPSPPGRMAMLTSTCFSLIGLALFIQSRPRGWITLPTALIGVVVVTIGLVAGFGYMIGLTSSYGWGQATRMAMHTALGMIALGFGLLVFLWHDLRASAINLQRWLPPTVALAAITASLLLWRAFAVEQQAQVERAIQLSATTARLSLEAQLDSRVNALRRMVRRWELRGQPSQTEWLADVELYQRDFPGYQAIAWVDPDLQSRWIAPANQAGQRLDDASEQARRSALLAARERGSPVLSPPLRQAGGQTLLLIAVPIRSGAQAGGYIVGVLQPQATFEAIFGDYTVSGYGIALLDGDQEIYRRRGVDLQDRAKWSEEVGFTSYGAAWRVQVWPDAATLAQLRPPFAEVALVGGTIVGLLIAAMLSLMQQARWRAQEAELARATLEAENAERRRAEAALSAAKLEAERANAAKSIFISRMSHELRTPLNAILGFAQLLEMDDLTPDHRESVGHIIHGGRHLLDLINEILDIARIESGRMTLSIEPVPIRDVIAEAVDLVSSQAATRNVRISVSTAGDLNVLADRQRLKQALLNLLSNAVKYNREGGSVEISADLPGEQRMRIAVRDTGRGMSPKQLSRLFSPFERLDADRFGIDGTGLGLALSRGLVEAMHGTLEVESVEGEGSTFWIELPLSQIERPTREPQPEPQPDDVAPELSRTLLYIEDNLPNYALVEHILARRPGIRLLATMLGSQGIEMARQHRPDLILLDLHLPDCSGEEVLAQLRADVETRDIPVVIVSADATQSQITRLLEAGARDYLTKPLNVRKFLNVLDEQLRISAPTEHL